MSKNGYLEKRAEERKALMNWTESVIGQYYSDTLQITLHEKFGWGADRLDSLMPEWEATLKEYREAINPDNKKTNEAGYWQAKMDRVFAQILRNKRDVTTFEERYPFLDKVKF